MAREVHAEREAILVEDAAADLAKHEPEQRDGEHLDSPLQRGGRRALVEGRLEEEDEGVEAELVHVVERA